MIITRGKHKGLTAKLHQAANDWISVDLTLADGTRKAEIVNPTSADFTQEDIDWLMDHAGGNFWREFEILRVEHGLIQLRKTPSPHRRPID